MTYDLYFHNDFDGVASAAVMHAFFKSRGERVQHFFPLDYLVIPEWKRSAFFRKNSHFGGSRNAPVVLDFPYHPKAVFWYDHHDSTFRKEEWERAFKPDARHRYDTAYLSCCRLVLDVLMRDFQFRPGAHLKELARWLDVIDGARYHSARETVELKIPALKLTACVEYGRRLRGTHFARFVKLLSELPMAKTLRDPVVSRTYAKVERATRRALGIYKKETRVIGKVAFMDESGVHAPTLRFAPLYFHPKALFVVRMRRDGSQKTFYHFSVGVNPWRIPARHPHVGRLLAGYGGGGHERVGGLEVKGLEKAKTVKNEIIRILNDSQP